MSEKETALPYFVQRPVDTQRITLTTPRSACARERTELVTHLEHLVWLAQQAYETYRDSPGSRWFEDAPPWKALPTDERDAWQRVAEALWGHLIGE